MQVEADLFIRQNIAQLGIGPLTSMYWYGENDRRYATDWRPEIHDSDGLALWTGKGERIWRPLINPPVGNHQLLPRRAPQGLRPHAAGPQLLQLPGRWGLL